MDKSMQYFNEAIERAQDNGKKADYYYNAAIVLFSQKQLARAKQYALESIQDNGNNGNP